MVPLQYKEYGKVTKVKGCIAAVEGLENCINGQLVRFGYGTQGMIIGFDKDEAQILIVEEKEKVKTGARAEMTLEPFNTPVGENFVGRIVNPLGQPLDDLGPLKPDDYFSIFGQSPSILERDAVADTLETGIKIVDSMLPIGRGQRQLILGDRSTGKTTIGTDIILNQKGKDIICIYCCIGKSRAALDRVVNLFKSRGVFEYTIVVAALAGEAPGQQYLSPYVSCSLGEYFMKKGGQVVVVFDDFTRHAWAYREISLLLDRPPGRESYPGDIFYLHSRMIERAAQFDEEHGRGSMTFFPIVETLEGDLTSYVPTNLVSMTDGQIYVNAALFGEGFKPAIDIGLSVSRIGTKAMWKALKKQSKSLRLEYIQYRELLKTSRLKSAGSSDSSTDKMKSGEILAELLNQPNDQPVPMEEEVVLFYGYAKKHLHKIEKGQIEKAKNEVFKFVKSKYPDFIENVRKAKDIDENMQNKLDMIYDEYVKKLAEEERQRMKEQAESEGEDSLEIDQDKKENPEPEEKAEAGSKKE